MRSQLLVTSLGEDRPGIVARLTEMFVANSANLEESRMAILGGEFAAIMLVSINTQNIPALEKDLARLQSEGISVVTRKTSAYDAARFKDYTSYEVLVKGADHEGIVHNISSFLKDKSINIQSVETIVVNAPVTGSPLFQMKAVIQVPPSISGSELKKNLDMIAEKESVDVELKTCHAAAC